MIIKKPTVRIIIPTYNRSNSIESAINSVLKQTFNDFELIIVDDGSKDNTSKIVEKFIQKDSRIKYLYQKNNGVASARNYGIIQDNPPQYIAFLDSDDIWFNHHLEASIAFLDKCPQLLLVSAQMEIIDHCGQYTKDDGIRLHNDRINIILQTASKFDIPHSYILDIHACRHALICGELTLRMSSIVVRTDMVTTSTWFDSSLVILEDIDFLIRMSNYSFGFLHENCGYYRHFGDNLSDLRDFKSNKMLEHLSAALAFQKRKLKLNLNKDEQLTIRCHIADTAYLVGQCMSEQEKKRGQIISIYLESLRNKISFKSIKSLVGIFMPTILKIAYIKHCARKI
jgi:glycosyltransferase involved in cell wall biosynthesis